jgi:hypothetical protein
MKYPAEQNRKYPAQQSGKIGIFILKLSSKAQSRPKTIKMAALVLEFAISVRCHPLSDICLPHTQ